MVSFRESSIDEPAAQALIAEYFGMRAETFPESLGDYRPTYPKASNFRPPTGVFLVVVEDGEDVGCGGIRALPVPELSSLPEPSSLPELSPVPELSSLPEPVEGPVRYEIKHLWIQPRAQGRGLGRALIGELERRALAFGATEVVLDTNDSLVAASNLYRTNGYAVIPPYNENPNATHWFRKELVG